MVAATGRQRPAGIRRPARLRRLAPILWIVLAVIVWNIVFDHVITAAERQYLADAAAAAARGGPYLRVHDAMRPAIGRAAVEASLAAAATLAAGVPWMLAARRRDRTPPAR